MTKLYNLKNQKKIRQTLRKQPIGAEYVLWQELRNKQLGYKFRRQFGIGRYIVDFYCPKLKLIIEVDGETHIKQENIESDVVRQKYFEQLGMKIIRFTNYEVYDELESVLYEIEETCRELSQTNPTLHPPLGKGRGD